MAVNFRKAKQRNACFQACLISILDREDIPHVFDDRPSEEAWTEIRTWLRNMLNINLLLIPTKEDPRELMREINPFIDYILIGGTVYGDHSIVCCGSGKEFDPSWYPAKFDRPTATGYYLIGLLI